MKIKSILLEIAEAFITSFIVIMLLYMVVASVEEVWGPSMEPNFHSGERILVDRITKRFISYKRGEVVVFLPPGDDNKHYIKRVVGIPGDVFKVIDCGVAVSRDGEQFKLEEPYLSDGTCTVGGSKIKEGRSLKIPDGQYALFGDNREESLDSRILGFVGKERILGRVVFRFWPVNKLGFIN
jgi:signal peptidase I